MPRVTPAEDENVARDRVAVLIRLVRQPKGFVLQK